MLVNKYPSKFIAYKIIVSQLSGPKIISDVNYVYPLIKTFI